MNPVDLAGLVTRTNFALGSYEKFQPGFRRLKKAKDPRDECRREIRKTKQTWENTIFITFVPTIDLATLKAVSLHLNGMLMMWKTQQAKQDNAIRAARIDHMAKCSARLPRSRLEKPTSREPSQPTLSYEHIENFTKGLEARRDLGNRTSPVKRS